MNDAFFSLSPLKKKNSVSPLYTLRDPWHMPHLAAVGSFLKSHSEQNHIPSERAPAVVVAADEER